MARDFATEKPTAYRKKKNPIAKYTAIVFAVIAVFLIGVAFAIPRNGPDTELYHTRPPVNIMSYPSHEEIGDEAIENYLFMSMMQLFQFAQAAGVDSEEYREFESRHAEYRAFRDARIRRTLERNFR
jgi:hypothetical protein